MNNTMKMFVVLALICGAIAVAALLMFQPFRKKSSPPTASPSVNWVDPSTYKKNLSQNDITADEFNNLSTTERLEMYSPEELEEMEEFGVYEDPGQTPPEWIPGTVPTKEQALALLYDPAVRAFELLGVYRHYPVILSDPWASTADEGGFSCYINNKYGTTVLCGHVNREGETTVFLYGSQYNEDFVGIMYSDKPENNPPEEMIIALEKAMIENPKSSLAMQIESYSGNTINMTDSVGHHFSYSI